jgi:trans-aconitate methyltransferase
LGWGKGGRQHLRFKILTEIGVQKTSSVLDVGCGFGDFYKYLRNEGWHGQYVGVDIVDELLREAKIQYPDITVRNEDILTTNTRTQFDYVISSGVFNAKLQHEENYIYILQMLKRMYELATVGVAGDFMSSYTDFQHEIAFHAEPEKIFTMAKTLSKRILLRHDYMPYEFTIYLYKDDSINKEKNVFETFLRDTGEPG